MRRSLSSDDCGRRIGGLKINPQISAPTEQAKEAFVGHASATICLDGIVTIDDHTGAEQTPFERFTALTDTCVCQMRRNGGKHEREKKSKVWGFHD